MKKLRTDLAFISEWIEDGSRILDLGCGDGSLLAHLRDTRNVTGYGIEIDDDNIARCIAQRVNVIHTDLNEGLSDFADQSFDYVLMTQAIQTIRRPDKVLIEMLRVGREGIVTFPNFGHWKVRFSLFFEGRMPKSRTLPNEWFDTENIHLCTVKDFENLCLRKGIEILQRAVLDVDHRPSFLIQLIPNLFGETALYRLLRRK